MGIKGIYGEIGNGRRVSLAKLAAEHIAAHGRPLKIAIDISIWLFQVQAGEGGASPAIRTLYFRLVRLLGLGIVPLFVFDGPNRPPFKRGAPTSSAETSFTKPAKRLIDLFGFRHHVAPGEAEAECALLQKGGVVDVVLSEDVDTLAFGCAATIRNWTPEGSRGNKSPTHVNLFTVNEIKNGKSGLDSQGMILVALMNGGDYLPAGIPGCGIKIACEAARAGFGHDLCDIARNDVEAFSAWRDRLRHELITNEAGFFKTKHKALNIPDDFPDPVILGYHAHPLVSTPDVVDELRQRLNERPNMDVKGLRDFVDEEFNWKHLSGAKKFLRQLAPALLVHKLRDQSQLYTNSISLDEQTDREERLIVSLMGRRAQFSTDGLPEVKVAFIPAHIVGLDLDHESTQEEEEGVASSDEEDENQECDDEDERKDRGATKRSLIDAWDPWALQKCWILEIILRIGAPLSLERWDTYMRMDKAKDGKGTAKTKVVRGGMKNGALDSYLRVVKPNPLTITQQQALVKEAFGNAYEFDTALDKQREQTEPKSDPAKPRSSQASTSTARMGRTLPAKRPDNRGKGSKKSNATSDTRNVNPWTLAQQKRLVANRTTANLIDREEGNPLSQDVEFPQHIALNSLTRGHHLNTVIRKSLEGTWKHADAMTDTNITPERQVSNVSIVDMTTDSEI